MDGDDSTQWCVTLSFVSIVFVMPFQGKRALVSTHTRTHNTANNCLLTAISQISGHLSTGSIAIFTRRVSFSFFLILLLDDESSVWHCWPCSCFFQRPAHSRRPKSWQRRHCLHQRERGLSGACDALHSVSRAGSSLSEQVGFKDSIFAQNLPADKAACYFHRSALICSHRPHCFSPLPPPFPAPLCAVPCHPKLALRDPCFCSELDIKQCLVSKFLN